MYSGRKMMKEEQQDTCLRKIAVIRNRNKVDE